MIKINRLPAVAWRVEENEGGRDGIGRGARTGDYLEESAAIVALAKAKTAGNGATVIVRNARGEGRIGILGIELLP